MNDEEEQEGLEMEEKLETLEAIVEELEDEQLNLERSIELFERGVKIAEEVKSELSEAEIRLKKVVESSELDFESEDFNL